MRRFPAALRFSTRLSTPTLLTLIASIALFSTFSVAAAPDRISNAISPGQFTKLQAGVPMKAQPKYDEGRIDPSTKLSYVTLLTVPTSAQQRAMRKLLADQQNPKSASYHKWLTSEEYADQFGLSPNDVSKITTWLKSQGFTVLSVARGRNWVTFSGNAAQIESALHTELHKYRVGDEMHFANSKVPSVPTALAGIVSGFRGLNDFRMKPLGAGKPQSRLHHDYYDANFNTNFIAPGDISTIYDLSPLYTAGIDGTGQTLAVAGQTDIYLADITNFRNGFNLPAISGCTVDGNGILTACNTTNLQYVLLGTDPGAPSPGDLGETDLDLEWSGAVAKNAQIIYVNGQTANGVGDAFYYAIDQGLAPVISLSYGICELGEAQNGQFGADETELQKANSKGITFLNSSGDVGAAGCDHFTNPDTDPPNLAIYGLQVSYPASSPEVTGVGGSALPYSDQVGAPFWTTTNGSDGNSALSYIPEQAWNDTFEFSAFCAANLTNPFCTGEGITDAASAQAALGIGAGGGGTSNCINVNGSDACTGGFPRPSWQTVTIPGTTTRLVPDISLLATPNFPGYIFCTPLSELGGSGSTSSCANGIQDAIDTNESLIGGTSVSTPVFAGMVVLLNQYLAGSPSPGLGNINPTLYTLAASSPSAFHPVLTGNNIIYCAPGTPSFEPVSLQCPNSGNLGFVATTFDATNNYNPVTGLGSIDLNNLAIAWAGSRTAATMTINANKTNILPNVSVTFTVTMSPLTAQGPISFFNNGSTTAFATATLSNGVATASTTALPVGTNNISASFGGDGYNMPSTTTTSAIVVVTAPTFNWVNTGGTTQTVLAGVPGTYTFTAKSTGSSTFAADVNFSCTGLPDATVTCAFSPTKIAAGTTGSTPVPVTLTITTSGPNTSGCLSCSKPKGKKQSSIPLALPMVGIMLVGFAGRKMSKYSAVAGLCVSLALLGLLIACGGGSNPVSVTVASGTPSSIYPNNAGWPSQTAQFTATVANTSNTAVNWSVSGGSANGTIDANGLYTSPTIAAGLPSSVTIIATSQADGTKSGQATETLTPATVPGTYPISVVANEDGTVNSLPVSITVQ
jgi:subtilase family serine protease